MVSFDDAKHQVTSHAIDRLKVVYGFKFKDYNYKEMNIYKAICSQQLAELNGKLAIDPNEFQLFK